MNSFYYYHTPESTGYDILADFRKSLGLLQNTHVSKLHESFQPSWTSSEKSELAVISIDLPGAKKSDITVTSSSKNVVVTGEVRGKKINMNFKIDDCYDSFCASAKLEDGILEVTVPVKKDVKPDTVTIEVK